MALLISATVCRAGDEAAAGDYLSRVLASLGKKGARFSAAGCARVSPERWFALFLMNQPIVHEVRFKAGCDIQGKLKITQEPFPVDLQVRNVHGVNRVKAVVATQIQPRLKAQEIGVNIKATNGSLFQKAKGEVLSFLANYDFTTALNGLLKENKGGDIVVSSYRGEPVKLTQHFQVEGH